MANKRTLKQVSKLILRFQVGLAISVTIGSLAATSLGCLCCMDNLPGRLAGANGELAAAPLLTLVAVIIFAAAGMIFSGGALIEIPARWEKGDM